METDLHTVHQMLKPRAKYHRRIQESQETHAKCQEREVER